MADKAPLESQTSAAADAAPTFPDKIRVHALAKLLGVTSKQVLAQVAELGSELRSAQSSVDRSLAEQVHAALSGAAETAAPSTEVAAVETPAAEVEAPVAEEPKAKAPRRRASRAKAAKAEAPQTEAPVAEVAAAEVPEVAAPAAEAQQGLFTNLDKPHAHVPAAAESAPVFQAPLFLQPEAEPAPRRRRARREAAAPDENAPIEVTTVEPSTSVTEVEAAAPTEEDTAAVEAPAADTTVVEDQHAAESDEEGDAQSRRRRRGRRGRGRGRGEQGGDEQSTTEEESAEEATTDERTEVAAAETEAAAEVAEPESEAGESEEAEDAGDGSSRRRRRRRRRKGSGEGAEAGSEEDGVATVVHEREPRTKARVKDEVQGISGSTRLEAKRQRRRDGRDAGRRRPPILTESEFLARRESVDRVMVVREKTGAGHQSGLTQVAVLEDGILVEHFVTSSASASMVGNVYLGRVQNVLPSMEAAFIDIGRGRNGVLYAGEVNWEAAGLGGNSRKIEQALRPGDQVLVQVSKDPVGHKGARLTTQISLAGRFLVYVPGGSSTGISRKLPDTERKRLKEILREIVPPEAGVIIRTASEGVSAEELARDVTRLQSQWADIEKQAADADKSKSSSPKALYEEPDMLVKVVRDLFNEDFAKIVIEGEKSWSTVQNYIAAVAPDLLPRVERYSPSAGGPDVFEVKRIDEQLAKALDRKVWLPSGGTLVIDRTEAMTVVDVNTGKFTGAGGNLEETVTRNNLEAAEEIVRQMRLRDIGGMIVVDFIDMVLESNRDLVLRRLTEALGRDRTRHQVSEVTSLGLVQMTRKKLGTGLVEAFSTTCEHCHGRGIIVHADPIEEKSGDDGSRAAASKGESGSRKRRGRGEKAATQPEAPEAKNGHEDVHDVDATVKRAHPVALAMASHHHDDEQGHEAEQGREAEPKAAEEAAEAGASDVKVDEAPVVAEVAVLEAPVVEAPVVEVAAEVAESEVAEAGVAETPAAEVAAPTRGRRRSRRSSRSAAAPVAEESDAVAVLVVPTPEPVAASVVEAPVVAEPVVETVAEPVVAEPEAAAPVKSDGEVKAPARRPRRRASARPAGPPTDA
ncbi:translation initiation factor IF-2 N-terminal domain-containing protein [Rhodococcus tukisamuensis]|uniref:Ribonuclease E n=1 Tax=Rhodococcus tukisamuensis TaxID=168276 RepID=A0A1G7A2U8_9NOCA|nr:translation initiation factor IF-2 N-terminal domain-containing protein [Rhodococcus tukisamuensis]SDE09081.1 ribonuclease E [Rhodococcus tukisamuensis]